MTNQITFKELNLSLDILKTIEKKGFKMPSEIQQKVIPIILENKKDIIGIAQTGTGKTGAFGLPIIDKISEYGNHTKTIILAPTRELAIQVTDELKTYKGNKKLNILTVYGGTSISNQIKELKRGADIVVGTPGRVLDLIMRKKLILDEIEYFILDEADEMLKMGFIEDIETILGVSSEKKRVFLFSATMPDRIKKLSKKYMQNQVIVEVKKKHDAKVNIDQIFYKVNHSNKFDALKAIIEFSDFFYGIVFCKTKMDVEEVTSKLKKARISADCIHGDIKQSIREKILTKFREQKLEVLVATDVAARGIDVPDLTHVINYSLPQENETYIHRIGRTGRAGKSGIAISLLTPSEIRKLSQLERETKFTLRKENLPNEKDILKKKQKKQLEEYDKIIGGDDSKKYYDLSKELLNKYGDVEIVSALLYKLYFIPKKNMDEKNNFKNYDNNSNDIKRVFIAKGKNQGMNKKRLFDFIVEGSGLKNVNGEDVKVCDNYSFITFNSNDAEKIINSFKKKSRGRSPVEIASN